MLNYGWEDTLRIYTDVAGAPAVIAPQVTKGEGHLGVVRDFVAMVRGGDWAAHDGSDGLRRTRIIDACYASAQAGREVTVARDLTREATIKTAEDTDDPQRAKRRERVRDQSSSRPSLCSLLSSVVNPFPTGLDERRSVGWPIRCG